MCLKQKEELIRNIEENKKREYVISQRIIPEYNKESSNSNLKSIQKIETLKNLISDIKVNSNQLLDNISKDKGPLYSQVLNKYIQIGCDKYNESDQYYKSKLSEYIDKYFSIVTKDNGECPNPSIMNINHINNFGI